VDVRIGWNPDSFGYNWQLPQIYKKSGVDYFVTQKMTWNDTNKLPLKLFWWQAPDGSRVLTYFPHDYVNDTQPDRLASDFNIAKQENPGLPELMHLYGIGDHGGGPTRAMLDTAQAWMSKDVVFPPSNFGTAQSYFSSVETKLDTAHAPVWNYSTVASGKAMLSTPPAGEISLPVWNDELYLEFHRGVFTTQANHKRNMRESEEWLLNAEKWSSLAWLAGDAYPQKQLNEGWKKVLFNQFHDLAAGSGIGVIYRDAQKDYDDVHWIANDADRNAFATLGSQINTTAATDTPAGSVPVVVLNPLAWSRTDVVSADVTLPTDVQSVTVLDADNKPVLSQVTSTEPAKHLVHVLLDASDVPSLGYEKFTVVPAASEATPKNAPVTDLSVNGTTLENSFLRVTVDAKTGCITSLYLKQSNTESLAANSCGNQLQTFYDKPRDWDAWNIDADALAHFTPIDQTDSVVVADKGPLRASIRITRHWQSSKFVQEIVLYAGIPRVDVVNDIDWQETHVLLKAAFTLASSSANATYEIPYGSIERPTTRNNSWEAAKFEVPAMRWADLGDDKSGFSLINESKYGYDAVGNMLRLSLLRSPISPDPVADKGTHHFTYSLYPHTANWKQAMTVRRGYELNYKLQAEQTTAHSGPLPAKWSFIRVDPANLVLTAVKKTEDGDGLLLRFYDWAGKSGTAAITVPKGVSTATETNLMEAAEGSALTTTSGATADTVNVPFTSYGITTVQVNYAQRGAGFYSAAK
jgi:alpha-mannosidase